MVWRRQAPRRLSILMRRGPPRRPRPPPASHTYLSVPSELGAQRRLAIASMAAAPYGQLTSISNDLVIGCCGLAASTPVALPLMV
jgi:hypothetical protein